MRLVEGQMSILIQNNKFPLKVNLDNFISAARGYLNFPATHLAAGIRWQREPLAGMITNYLLRLK